jgi:hypothetical protein
MMGHPDRAPKHGTDSYGGFLLDPDGNSVEAVNDTPERRPGAIDHLWIRVADLAAARRFYETVAPHARTGRWSAPASAGRLPGGTGRGRR